jgi:predicted ribosome quality control (RQC) complex YloA/Tae2 family protein
MERTLLRRVVAEMAGRLLHQEIQRVAFLGSSRYLLRFAGPDRLNLRIAVRPERPGIHLATLRGPRREPPPDPFAALLDRDLSGARLVDIDQPEGDRLVRLTFAAPDGGPAECGRRLVVELLGRRANALLLDPSGGILAAARDPAGGPRALSVGGPYHPPPRRDPGNDAPAFPDPFRDDDGATVLSPRPLADYREGERPEPDQFQILPGRIAPEDPRARDGEAVWYPTVSEAVEVVDTLLERLIDFDGERERLVHLARRERERLDRLDRNLARDFERAAGADCHRRFGEALLAGLRDARVAGGTASVPDPESPEGVRLEVPIDPSLSLQLNAEQHFAAWKKGKRGVAAIAARRSTAAARREAWGTIESTASTAASATDLEAVRARMADLGLVHAAPRPARAARPARPEPPARVRRHTTRDGFVILVGRSGAENDTLTFKVASPWDFWLHASGVAGAHVVVRNPTRLGALPDAALQVAAGIAAWYSDARADTHVEVHWTQRKHVRKRKGMPAGQVILKRSKSIRVEPRLPDRAFEEP